MIHIDPAGAVLRLEAQATVEDAEPLLRELLAQPGLSVDLSNCGHLHAASLLVLMSTRPPLSAPPPGSGARQLLQACGLLERESAGAATSTSGKEPT